MRRSFTIYFTKQGLKAQKRITFLSNIPNTICALLFWGSIFIISTFSTNDVLLNIGIGILSSSIVTSVFLMVDYVKNRIEKIKERARFLDGFELYLLDLVNSVPRIKPDNIQNPNDYKINFEEYIVLQHRKFHDCYKTLLVNNADDIQIASLLNESSIIIGSGSAKIIELFESPYYHINIGAFDDNEAKLLASFYNNFKAMEKSSQNKENIALYYTAMWLTDARRLVGMIEELHILKQIHYRIEKRGFLAPDYTDIEKEEPFIIQRNEFSKIRMSNYEKCYGKSNIKTENADTEEND